MRLGLQKSAFLQGYIISHPNLIIFKEFVIMSTEEYLEWIALFTLSVSTNVHDKHGNVFKRQIFIFPDILKVWIESFHCCRAFVRLSLLTFQTIYVNQTRELNYANRSSVYIGIKFRAFSFFQTDSF